MKKEKKLKLDQLSSRELKSREVNQIRGGSMPCGCRCWCSKITERYNTAERVSDVDLETWG
ncbi:MAG: rSAM-modified peptide [Bacteroidales bacterium]|nr:MAG: rSAM-modified peptide [Bacteroidales bacterium]